MNIPVRNSVAEAMIFSRVAFAFPGMTSFWKTPNWTMGASIAMNNNPKPAAIAAVRSDTSVILEVFVFILFSLFNMMPLPSIPSQDMILI
jgi:hypothetical protein